MDIESILSTNPSLIASHAGKAEEIRLEWQQAKEIYTHDEALFILKLKATMTNLKSTEMKYYINNDINLYNKRMNLIVKESSYRKEEVEVKSLEEELRAAKMLARMKISEMDNLEGSVNNGLGK